MIRILLLTHQVLRAPSHLEELTAPTLVFRAGACIFEAPTTLQVAAQCAPPDHRGTIAAFTSQSLDIPQTSRQMEALHPSPLTSTGGAI